MFYEVYFTVANWNFVILKGEIYLIANSILYLTFSMALIFCPPEVNK